jgi:hydroxyacylglutathione hydrolase
MTKPPLILKQAEIGPMANFIYVLGCPETGEGAVVDPAWDADTILKIAAEAGLRITQILLTHGHPDHINAVEAVLEATDAIVQLHRDEVDYMRQVAEYFQMPVEFMNRRSGNFKPVTEGEQIRIGNLSVDVLHTPGHSPGSQCFLVHGNLISGDTLFIDACGRVDFPGGDAGKMWHSLNRRLATLPDDTIVYPGHHYGYRTTASIGEQKQTNPYLRHDSPESFLRLMGY